MAATRTDLTDALKDGERGALGGIKRQRGRQELVVAEIALAFALLTGAGLALGAGMRLTQRFRRVRPPGTVPLQIPLPDSRSSGDRADTSRDRATRAVPPFRVSSAPRSRSSCCLRWSPAASFVVERDPIPDAARRPRTGYRAISADLFDTLRIAILSGRAFSSIDREGGRPVAIVSVSLAQRSFPGPDAVGRRVRLGGSQAESLPIVGVAGDVRMFNWWDGEDSVAVYVPLRQAPVGGLAYAVVRTSGDRSR